MLGLIRHDGATESRIAAQALAHKAALDDKDAALRTVGALRARVNSMKPRQR
jgi:hypothetical protein